MMKSAPIRRTPDPAEEGYLLVAVIFMLAILIISLAVAAPRVRDDIQRDRDVETMRRGQQYVRAIQLYYRKFGAYPPNIDALVNTGGIRFLRKRYIDPITRKDDWKPIQFGQNKTPTAMGFFGQPLAGSTLAGVGPSGGNAVAGASPIGSGFGSSPGGSSIFGSTSTSPTASTSPMGGASPVSGASPTAGTTGSTAGSPSGSTPGSTDTSGSSGSGSSSGSGLTGQTFGGAGIIGFSPASPKKSILIFKKKDHYNQWEFTYDPAMEQMSGGLGGGAGIGQPATGLTGGAGGIGGSSFGSGSSFGPTSPSPTSPTNPMNPTSPTSPAPQ